MLGSVSLQSPGLMYVHTSIAIQTVHVATMKAEILLKIARPHYNYCAGIKAGRTH